MIKQKEQPQKKRPDRARPATAQPPKKQHKEFATPSLTEEQAQFADFVINCLDEKDKTAQWQIRQIVQALGHVRVLQLMRETLAIEEAGGMLTKDGQRRRTPGGTFFILCKRYHKYQVQHIFAPWSPRRTTPPVAPASKLQAEPASTRTTPTPIKKKKKPAPAARKSGHNPATLKQKKSV